jgi:phosphoribosylanthranilate isomerase
MTPVWIKICGVTTPADAVHAIDCGADAIGLNFYPGSKRYVSDEQAVAIVREVPSVETVGVFVDLPARGLVEPARRFGLRAVQTYRPFEESEYPVCPELPRVIGAFRVQDAGFLNRLVEGDLARWAGAVLLDSFVVGEVGGTGHPAPWELIARYQFPVPVILAGGLTPDNVAEAIRLVRPWGVDVASGVESAPGRKDPGKVRAFVQAVRAVTV